MNAQTLALLRLLETEFGNTILPAAGSDIARLIATVSGKLVSRRLAEEWALPGLQAATIGEVAELLPQLRGPVDAGLCSAIEESLSGASWEEIEPLLQQAAGGLIAKNESVAKKLAAKLVAIDARLREGFEAAYWERCEPKPATPNAFDLSKFSDEQQAALLGFIKQKFPAETGLSIASVRPLAGGFSKQTVFINLANNVTLPGVLVLRRDAPYQTSGTSVTMEYQLIARMFATGVPVAQPFAMEDTGKVLGTKFMLTAGITGTSGDPMIVPRNPTVAADLARVVAHIHAVPFDGLEATLPGGTISVRERMQAAIEADDASWKGLQHFHSFTVQTALDWLKLNIDLADGPKVIVHRDIGMHNLLVREDQVAAILDWETAAIGTRADDLGWLYHTACQLWDWDSFIDVYQKEAGVVIDPRQLDYYVLWSLIRMTALVSRIGNAVLSGDIKNIQLMYVGDHLKETLISRLAAKFSEVLARG